MSIHFQCKISLWFQELMKYQKQKQKTTSKITIKNDSLLSVEYKHLCKYKLRCMIEGQSLSISLHLSYICIVACVTLELANYILQNYNTCMHKVTTCKNHNVVNHIV